jgi:hypothetical protein
MVTPTYEEPGYTTIVDAITTYSPKLNLPAEIYQLGAEAQQMEIDEIPYPELVDMPGRYNKMAEWYWRINSKSKAIEAQQKAIEAAKIKKGFSSTKLAAYESTLKQYKSE